MACVLNPHGVIDLTEDVVMLNDDLVDLTEGVVMLTDDLVDLTEDFVMLNDDLIDLTLDEEEEPLLSKFTLWQTLPAAFHY